MDFYAVEAANVGRLLSSSSMPTICSNQVPVEQMQVKRKRSPGLVSVEEKSSKTVSKRLRNDSKKELSRMLWTEAAIKAIERKAGSQKYNNLWPKAVLEALDEAIKEYRWESALKILGLLRKQHWYKPRCQTYTKLLMMLGKCKKPEQASLLFNVMLSDGLRPTIDVYTALVNAYGLSGLFDRAFSTIEDMTSVYDCKPDVHTYTVLISCSVRHRRFDLINRILTEMSCAGIKCNNITYNAMVDGFGKAELFEQMEKSLSEMIESGSFLPDIFTLNSFISAYGYCGKIDDMEKWFDEFQLMGIKPDVRSFNILIRSYGKAGLYEKMELVLNFMKNRFFPPTVVTFNTVIAVHGSVGNVEKMNDVFKKMKHLGIKPNKITYSTLVNAYSKARKLSMVDSILRQVKNSDVILDTTFFNCIIGAYGRAGDLDKMGELFLFMKEKNCKPDNITFATMIQALKLPMR
ncbi:hypothetical protein Nepgr_020846 [Nepenthes gracilis]|uniref:Pentatricopeptide repeat-containing protein n=1 Tax=Nepenthes gracilis TaxID=150966 RepID=A0AAD3XWM5_NEPGR|nr:hypothetical protein Nepgr_020846 [Nepenthes gracilis]